MSFTICYSPSLSKKSLLKIDKAILERIKKSIENRLTEAPHMYGSPLKGRLKHLWKLRVGDWRVVYEIKYTMVTILVIGHRSEVYKV